MPFSTAPPARRDFTDRGGDWVDALIDWLRQFQDYVNRMRRNDGVSIGGGNVLPAVTKGIIAPMSSGLCTPYNDGRMVNLASNTLVVYNGHPSDSIPDSTICWVVEYNGYYSVISWAC